MLFFDIETDGLLEDLTKIHCMCIKDTSTDTMYRYTPENIEDGIKKLMMAGGMICGHNVIAFDLPAIKKLYPWFTIRKDKVIDIVLAYK